MEPRINRLFTRGAAATAVALPLLMTPSLALALDGADVDATAGDVVSAAIAATETSDGDNALAPSDESADTNAPAPTEAPVTDDGTTAGDDTALATEADDAQHASEADARDEGDAATNAGAATTNDAETADADGTTTDGATVLGTPMASKGKAAPTTQVNTATSAAQGDDQPQGERTTPSQMTGDADAKVATLVAQAQAQTQLIADGLYEIIAGTSGNMRVEIAGGSTLNGGRAQIYTTNDTEAQRWRIKAIGNGYYTLQNVKSGRYLDVPNAAPRSSLALWQYGGNSTAAQQWRIVEDPKRKGYYILQSRINPNFVVDITGASASRGATVQLYMANGTIAQSFRLSAIQQVIADGFYTIANVNSGMVLNVNDSSLNSGGNIQQYSSNGTMAQTFRVAYDKSSGYYTIINAQSGKVLDVAGGRMANSTNIQQYSYNGTQAQRWVIKRYGSSYGIFSLLDGRAIDVCGASKASRANVQTYASNGTGAQRWTFTSVSEWLPAGTYEIVAANNSSNAISVSNGSYASGAGAITAARAANNTFRKWQLVWDSDGYARLINLGSGYALSVSNAHSTQGAQLTQTDYTGASAQKWQPVLTYGGIRLQSKLSPKVVVDLSGGSTSTGTRVQTYTDNGTIAQRFLLVKAGLYTNGAAYVVHTVGNRSYALDMTDGSKDNGARLRLYGANGSYAQAFIIRDAGNGQVRIVNANSGKYLSTNSSTNVVTQVSSSTGSDTLWKIGFDADINALRITSVATGWVITGTSARTVSTTPATTGDSYEGYVMAQTTVTNTSSRLNGIDISNWQAGIDLATVPADFVIIKATEGTTYTNSYYKTWANQTLALGRKLGFYHFITASASAAAQAQYFVNAVKDYVGQAVLILDFEDTSYSKVETAAGKGTPFAKAFMDEVYRLTKVRPVVYTNRNGVSNYNWTAVANAGYELWMAQYLYRYYDTKNGTKGYVKDPYIGSSDFGAWTHPVMYQYTSTGLIGSWKSFLDLNVFYGTTADWDRLASRR